MNLGELTDDTSEDRVRRVVTHEFGHALGLVHEHQSPAAGIQWDKEQVYAWFWDNLSWDRAKVDQQVLDRYTVSQTNYSQYDPASIMHYPVPASLTLDGKGIDGQTKLSPTDKEWVARWYPPALSPRNSAGLLRTGDDCDEIDFSVEYQVVGQDDVEFALAPASQIDWWKAIEVPVGQGEYRMFQMENGSTGSGAIPRAEVDGSRPLRFWKAKGFGVHTRLTYTWDVLQALPGGSRLTLTWKRDRC